MLDGKQTPGATAPRQTTELFNFTVHGLLYKKQPPSEFGAEYRKINQLDLSDPMVAVDAKVRLKTLVGKLGPIYYELEKKIDEGKSTQKIVQEIVEDNIKADRNGFEIRSILARKPIAETEKMVGNLRTSPEVLTALCSPVSELLGVSKAQRDKIPELLVERDPLYQEATEQLELAQSEFDSIQKRLAETRSNVVASLEMHRQKTPGLMQSLER